MLKQHIRLPGNAIVALLLVSLILLLDAMAACPALHELVHPDADSQEHHCAVTLFAHGQVDVGTVEISLFAATVGAEMVPQVRLFTYSPCIENLPAGRAPPVSPAVS